MSELRQLLDHFKKTGSYKFINEVENVINERSILYKYIIKRDKCGSHCARGCDECYSCIKEKLREDGRLDTDQHVMGIPEKDIDAGIKKLVSKDNINDGGVMPKENIKSNDTYMLRIEGKSNDTYMLRVEGKTLASIVNKLAVKIQDFEIAAEARIFGEQLDE